MEELSLFDVALAVMIGGLIFAQRRVNRGFLAQLRLTRETAEDLGWNWERDETR